MSHRQEVVALLQGLLRLDTVNPPGNETLAAEHLRAYLAAHGVASHVVGKAPERASVLARLPGSGSGPSLLL
ncbi:MAG: peptidase M20, partial [Thermoleophilia bacterium]|nr:peptidase M20 [Thermoleophilia bacterium]